MSFPNNLQVPYKIMIRCITSSYEIIIPQLIKVKLEFKPTNGMSPRPATALCYWD